MPDSEADGGPPETPRRPVTEELHGESVTDPYRWLEGDDEAVREWTDAQDAYAERVLDTPARARLRERFAETARRTDYGPVVPAGGRLFQEVTRPADEQPVLYAYEEPSAVGSTEGTTLADPNEAETDEPVSVDWFAPGPEGAVLAYGVAEGGDEQYDVVVVETASGEVIETLPGTGRTQANGFAWVPAGAGSEGEDGGEDESEDADSARPAGFYYVSTGAAAGDPDADGQLQKAIRYHALGSEADPSADPVVADDFAETVWPQLETDDDALVVRCLDGWERADVYGYRGDPAAATLEPVLVDHDAVFEATLAEGTLYLVTDLEAPFSRLLAADLADVLGEGAAAPADFREVIPETDAVLRGVEPAGDRLLAHYHRDARSELAVFAVQEGTGEPALTREGTVELPSFPTVSGLAGAADEPVAYHAVESFVDPPSVRRVDLAAGTTETLCREAAAVDVDLRVSQERFESADGTEIPAFVVRRADLEPDGEHPALLTGYGGFRVNRTPTFDRFRLPFLRAGGVFVLATLRGGSEYGEAWHDAGRREHKQRVFDDALAVADGLVERGWADGDRLGVTGGSNGGLLVGALTTQRPERFRVALCHVPLLDMLRFHRFLLGASWTVEYGSPEDPVDFQYLREYSPYHNAPEAAYPATMFTTALGDTRVHPAHARKMTALVQERNVGPRPVVLRVESDAGHGVGKPVSMRVRENAERWGFVFTHLEMDVEAGLPEP